MTADIHLAVSVIRTVFAQNHRAAATAADDHANTPNNKKKPLPQHEPHLQIIGHELLQSNNRGAVQFSMKVRGFPFWTALYCEVELVLAELAAECLIDQHVYGL